jgi:hypothetical protein
MKRYFSRLLPAAAAAAGLFMNTPVQATQPGPAGNPKIVDCDKARNPERCQARQAARAACQGKQGAARRQCLEDNMPPPDCSKAPDPGQCATMIAARAACKDKSGPERRQCLREQAAGMERSGKNRD